MNKCNLGKSCDTKCNNKKTKYFTQFICEEKITIPNAKPDVEDIISVLVDPEIVSVRIIDTPKGTSAEGQKLSGKKISFEIKLRQKVMYVSKTLRQSVHVVENECYQSIYVVIPSLIEGCKPEELLKNKLLKWEIIVENASATKIDDRNIFKTVLLFIKIRLVPSYVLCYTEKHNCHESCLYLCYEDGTKKSEIICCEDYKILKPQWSPSGKRIGFIGSSKDSSILCITDIKGGQIIQLTDPYIFKYISGFSWCSDSNNLLFTNYMGNRKEIFRVDINTLEWKQLTYGDYCCSSFMPKCSWDGDKIAYLKTIGNETNIYTMKGNGLSTKKITKCGVVKDFNWENNSERIAYVFSNYKNDNVDEEYTLKCEKSGDEIFIIDMLDYEEINLHISRYNLKIRSLKFSPNNEYIAFIGEQFGFENIYIYDLLKNELINFTENDFDIKIGNYDWKIDSTAIYYSSDELCYYNVYYIELEDKCKVQISNTTSSDIKLSYRPKIV